MNLSANDLRLNSFHATASTSTSTILFKKTSIHFLQVRVYRKRRRFKLTVRSSLNYPFENLFHSLPNLFASTSSLDLLAPALGLFSGLAIYASQSTSNKPPPLSCIGNWVLFTSPTPFNRFVILRCPSISLKDSDFLENVNEKLVKEDRHFVRLNSGRIQVRSGDDERASELETKLKYQRVCINTEDGGVVSLDWPANLDLMEEHGLDTTLLLVPGTAEGSMEKSIRSFVCETLEHGFFPVVMNPRGCGGSPLTTARLFTAADSDDICTAIQFINKARPWTTLMGVGWGYGANMLTKYLAEVGESTPLTAVTCIDNPFDLEEVTRSSPHHIALDQKLTNGLIDILRSNKELFQGRAKGFDVEKALLAKSVRDFEQAISMVSYGFEAIEDFYSESSTRSMAGNVKIPVLFIQNDSGTLPPFSVPRSLIAENPYTSLLLCSCPPSTIIASNRAAEYWCQHLTIEWLTAVELGLLKGRHPLLKDVDVTINPSKGLALVEGRATDKDVKVNKLLDLSQTNALNSYSIDGIKEMLEKSNDNDSIHQRYRREPQRNVELDKKELQEMDNGALQETGPVDAELVKEEEGSPVDSERSQVLQSTQVVMNMLDVTMPGTLTEEEKKKVLTAVGQGETIMKALQDAVPEDVRGNLMAAVSGILHVEGRNLKLDGLLDIGKIPNVKSKIQEKVIGISSAEGLYKDPHRADQVKRVDNLAEGSDNVQPGMAKPDGGLPSENFPKSDDVGLSKSMSGPQSDISSSVSKNTNESGNNHENDGFTKEKAVPYSNIGDKGSEISANSNNTGQPEKAVGPEEYESKVEQEGGVSQVETKPENSTQKAGDKALDPSSDQNKMTSANVTEDTVSPMGSSSEAQSIEKEGDDNRKRENKTLQPAPDLNPSTFSVSQALDALTGMDDSTQMAVNNVFGVIENMITQLEEENGDANDVKERNEVKDEKIDHFSEKQRIGSHERLEKEDFGNELSLQSPASSDPSTDNSCESGMDIHHDARTERVEGEHNQNPILFDSNGPNYSQGNKIAKSLDMEKKREIVGSKLLSVNSDGLNYGNNLPLYNPVNPYGESTQNEHLSRYPISKMPNAKSLDLDTTTALLLDYFPEEGQWKLWEQTGNFGDSIRDFSTCEDDDREVQAHSFAEVDDADKFIEPPYVILDTDKQQEPAGEYKMKDHMSENVESSEVALTELMRFVKNIMFNSLKVEVERKLSPSDRKEMESNVVRDIEKVANAVSLAVGNDREHIWYLDDKHYSMDCTSEKVGALQGENIIRAISSAVQGTSYLRKVLPVGVIGGSSLAALRKYFNVSTENDNGQKELMVYDLNKKSGGRKHDKVGVTKISQMPFDKNTSSNVSVNREVVGDKLKNLNNGGVMAGAVTAALGASALLVKQSDSYENKIGENMSKPLNEKENHQKEPAKLEEAMSERNQNSIVTSLAEKAMSVAGPVVPTKGGGEVDQDRLVTMLADLGQKGGMLKLVGKIALLWGGLRGAMSLTDKLILFLRIADRPLFQRILGFVGMVLVLWSPVVVPLLPTLVQSWATNNPSRIAELACIIGLYTAVMILVVIWGRRIHGYENPLERYGLDMTSLSKGQNFLKGFIAGVMLVLLLQSVKALLGCANFSWPSSIPSPLNAVTWLRVCGKSFMLACRGIITATAVLLVEELLFRSWLPEEIATDLGYHRGIMISGLAFSLFQRSPQAIPGLWLLSLALAGLRQRSQGSLSVPIGLRAGIMASSLVLQTGGFLTYNPHFPVWVTGTYPFQPFSGVFGLVFCLLLAVTMYPRQPLGKEEIENGH
ncbi:uncharacterized protein LOC116142018 [Pistacia vera]|uniref:uncharacterized protein LOC116142018 n=1 Tax=Pistacia vera TaxID=55513 RepID=UPI001263BC53|nr:uncharacterized protein LOC116142018 [Pistacia vera]